MNEHTLVDVLMLNLEAVLLLVYEQTVDALLSFVRGHDLLSLPPLAYTLLVVYLIFRLRDAKGIAPAERGLAFLRYLRLREVYLHPSAKLDYAYWFASRMLRQTVIGPLYLLLLIPTAVLARDGAALLEGWLGPSPYVYDAFSLPLWLYLVYGFAYLFVQDLANYWSHRLSHHVPVLWEFHKIHHAAEVLTPFTAARIHPFEQLVEKLLRTAVTGVTIAAFFYVFGDKVQVATVLGVHYLIFFSNVALSKLRHTHIWVSFGPYVEYVLMSPAQHQIHHSIDPRHHGKNYAVYFTFWDWLFGTLYICGRRRENLTFGLGTDDSSHYRSLYGLLVRPFVGSAQVLLRGLGIGGSGRDAGSGGVRRRRLAGIQGKPGLGQEIADDATR